MSRPDEAAGPTPPSVLLISSLYPSDADPVFGAFVAKQHDALVRLGVPHRLVVNTRSRPGALSGLWKYTLLLARTLAAARRRDFDVVLGHFLYPTAWLASLAARIAGVPYVVVAHGTDVASVRRRGPLARACLSATRRAACVVAVSRDMERRVRVELGVPAAVRTQVIDMGVDRRVFRPIAGARATMRLPPDARVALFAGNLIERKAPGALLDAFSRCRAAGACDLLLLAGDGPLRAILERRAVEPDLAGAVTFVGAVPAQRLTIAMSAADVFVLPSLAEPLGVVLLEAMACGTPCVGSNVGGIPEVVDVPSNGRLAEPGDAESLAAAMEEVLVAGRDTFVDACLATAARHDLDANTARLVEVLTRAAGREGEEGS